VGRLPVRGGVGRRDDGLDRGVRLRVEWGDGAVSEVPVTRSRGRRALLRHTYAASGKYTMQLATVGDPLNCVVRQTIELPYDGGDEPDAVDIVPPDRRFGLDDAELDAEADAQRSPIERLLDRIAGIFGR
jgi:hypothetical protein